MSFTHYPRLEDCPCYGGFACRGGDGACKSLARQQAAAGEEHSACHAGAKLCREVPADLEPPRSNLAAAPDVCAFYFHRRAAAEGNVDAMHILSHAYSNGHRGAAKDTAAAFAWSWGAMEAGDLRGTFDVAYSLEPGHSAAPEISEIWAKCKGWALGAKFGTEVAPTGPNMQAGWRGDRVCFQPR
ncbi:unnamed protein product [Effrenium voratum]|nr:unnamed protein product [Effrenium voratum]